jgi:hypothetical protein
MLHEFHQQAKLDGKPCSATYILSGLVEESVPGTASEAMQIEDDFPMSSPAMATQESSKSSGANSRMIRVIALANESEVYG